MKRNISIAEKPGRTTVAHECDICVVGGSCTGVFAAVRASRLGAKVAIIEKQNSFGGVATQGLINIWHSFNDTEFKKEIMPAAVPCLQT
jgi:ribulose 1,5-bisphosphate synthetase/thiazole synthase